MTGEDRAWSTLNAQIEKCKDCGPHMNVEGKTASAPGFGDRRSPVAIVGQSLCRRCMLPPKEPFRGGSERFITAALNSRPKSDLFVTNVVHCHPEGDRRSLDAEIDNCRKYLRRELELVAPRLVIGLGRDPRAHAVLAAIYPDVEPLEWWLGSPPVPTSQPALVFFPHPSWVKFQPKPLREEWVRDLARVIDWGFR